MCFLTLNLKIDSINTKLRQIYGRKILLITIWKIFICAINIPICYFKFDCVSMPRYF